MPATPKQPTDAELDLMGEMHPDDPHSHFPSVQMLIEMEWNEIPNPVSPHCPEFFSLYFEPHHPDIPITLMLRSSSLEGHYEVATRIAVAHKNDEHTIHTAESNKTSLDYEGMSLLYSELIPAVLNQYKAFNNVERNQINNTTLLRRDLHVTVPDRAIQTQEDLDKTQQAVDDINQRVG